MDPLRQLTGREGDQRIVEVKVSGLM